MKEFKVSITVANIFMFLNFVKNLQQNLIKISHFYYVFNYFKLIILWIIFFKINYFINYFKYFNHYFVIFIIIIIIFKNPIISMLGLIKILLLIFAFI